MRRENKAISGKKFYILIFCLCVYSRLSVSLKYFVTLHSSLYSYMHIINKLLHGCLVCTILSVASRSIICRRQREIIDLRDTDKSRYFARTELNNCFIIQVSKTTHLPKVQESGCHCMFTKIEGNAHAQSNICS